MNRASMIATVVATTGVLVAGSIASVAVINAASSSETPERTITLVADTSTSSTPTSSISADAAPALPALPEVPVLDALGAAASEPVVITAPSGNDDQLATSSDDRSAGEPAASVSSATAKKVVLAETAGRVLSVSKASHDGYRAWAVKVQRADGSIVTGYVDRASGVVYDWVVIQGAPQSSGSSDDDDDAQEESDDDGDDDDSDEDDSDDDADEDDSDDDSDEDDGDDD